MKLELVVDADTGWAINRCFVCGTPLENIKRAWCNKCIAEDRRRCFGCSSIFYSRFDDIYCTECIPRTTAIIKHAG